MKRRVSGVSSSQLRSLSSMQFDAVLEDVRVSSAACLPSIIIKVIATLRSAFSSIKEHDITTSFHTASVPSLPLFLLSARATDAVALHFLPPISIDAIGSAPLRVMCKDAGLLTIDIAVEMPAECFKDRDTKAYAYCDKRSMYLGVSIEVHSEC